MFQLKINLNLSKKLEERILKNIEEHGVNRGVAALIKLNDKYVFLINEKEPFNKEWMFVSGGVEKGRKR